MMTRARRVVVRGVAISCWLLGTFTLNTLSYDWVFGMTPGAFAIMVRLPIFWMYFFVELILTSPLLWLWWGRVGAIRDGAAPSDLGGLSVGLARLVTSARTVRVALESPDEGAFRLAWLWQADLGELDEEGRRQLERGGLGDFTVTPILERAAVAGEKAPRIAKLLNAALAEFERKLLTSASTDPFR